MVEDPSNMDSIPQQSVTNAKYEIGMNKSTVPLPKQPMSEANLNQNYNIPIMEETPK